jgi:hypothetical protein
MDRSRIERWGMLAAGIVSVAAAVGVLVSITAMEPPPLPKHHAEMASSMPDGAVPGMDHSAMLAAAGAGE